MKKCLKKILRKKNIKFYATYYLIVELLTHFTFSKIFIELFMNLIYALRHFSSPGVLIRALLFYLFTLLAVGIMLLVVLLPVSIFLIARKTAHESQEYYNQKYISRENLTYYREKFKNISPTTISLCQNLKIEEEKDIVATIMKLQLNKNITMEGNEIKILSEDVSNLTTTEQSLFHMIVNHKINKLSIREWKKVAIDEAKREGYIKDKKSSEGLRFRRIILISVYILCWYLFIHIGKQDLTDFPTADEVPESIQMIEQEQGNPERLLLLYAEEKEFMDQILLTAFYLLASIVILLIILVGPTFYIIYMIISRTNNTLKRTIEGEKLTDKILGMKNFIHDFSMLGDADKEAVILWDDFLVYAIVLEENTKIIEEILELKNIQNYDKLKGIYSYENEKKL